MTTLTGASISRKGLPEEFPRIEREVSSLILSANYLKRAARPGEAAERFARAALLEEELSQVLMEKGLNEKAISHYFSAASCWAQAGNIHLAISMCEALLARPDLPQRVRDMVEQYAGVLRSRRDQWLVSWVPRESETPVPV